MKPMSSVIPSTRTPRRPAICVFCGSSFGADPIYAATAKAFGTKMVERGFDLVFGGGGVGLMGEVAGAAAKAGGHVLGIIPGFLRHLEPPLKISSEIVITESMNERKWRMFAACDAFAVLPGGIGTLDEFAEALTGAQLQVHAKPIVLVNVNNYFAPLTALLEHFVAQRFAGPNILALIDVAPTVDAALDVIGKRVKAKLQTKA
jgi:uncharacterized protein (TIGR00730 family)